MPSLRDLNSFKFFATLQDIMVTATVKTEEPIMGYQLNKTNKNETQVLDQVFVTCQATIFNAAQLAISREEITEGTNSTSTQKGQQASHIGLSWTTRHDPSMTRKQ